MTHESRHSCITFVTESTVKWLVHAIFEHAVGQAGVNNVQRSSGNVTQNTCQTLNNQIMASGHADRDGVCTSVRAKNIRLTITRLRSITILSNCD